MQFTVVESLLGPAVHLTAPPLTIRPPRDWAPLDSSRRALLEVLLQERADSLFHLRPEQVFFNPANRCALVLSTWSMDSARGWKDVERQRRASLDAHLAGRTFQHDTYLIGDQMCLQTLIQDSLMVNFKLLLANGVQLDYLVPQPIYASQAELIESSLGSLTIPSTSQRE